MKSSAYYYKQMQDIAGKQDALAKKDALYREYRKKLIRLHNGSRQIANKVNDAGNTLAIGGYTVDGEILCQDDFTFGLKSFGDALTSLDMAIRATGIDIENMSKKMESLINKFNTAKKNYKAALKRENS